jgi:hypothetical protein
VDATAEVREAAIAWRALALVPKVHAEDFRCWAAQVELDHEVRRGVVVEVVFGRKIRHGVQGTVFWVGDDQFSPAWQHRPKRVGFVTDDGTKMYTAITNVAVVDADPPALSEYTSTDEEALVVATEEARRELGS